ncbi:Alkyl sulfatase BDS1, metallo-beta-lactamase superfamily [Chryseobacterium arachidis]|uniref:Linear primary-alkylsulfatase n=2 Tax=Chryseobacterium arachidis TaxID=1416778 RepID=A0A1M5HEH3_9FLAO|nr:alkyl sulfatase dimerization domain-containing protein [Chryseobacterium arachidis]SHG14356.1 Alkyl sulfatase BDS1, metallo-beta-lactamase superfamily [Chryseobacterium arachidis]
MQTIPTFLLGTAIVTGVSFCQAQNKKTSIAEKQSTSYTEKSNNALTAYLPFNDNTDFDNAQKGLIATLPSGEIKDSEGNISYSVKAFDFLKSDAPTTANPSLWRQSRLNAVSGLFKVTDNIYQIRGFDLANMTLVKGKTGWIVIDPLTVQETALAGMELVKKHIGDFPVKAVLLTHSHIDHFGGMRAFINEKDIQSGAIKVYAPEGFFEHSISENVMGGNAMSRRAAYMYGNLLPKSAVGSLGSGLGTTTAKGSTGILEPTDIISKQDGETKIIDGVKIEFIYTPESEAPAEMMFYFPEFKAFCQAENISHTLHNLYTLRGAQVRNGLKWSSYIDKSIQKFGDQVEVSFGSHHWPVWGNDNIIKFWENQRDMYRFIHDQTLRLANQGYTPTEIAEILTLPDELNKQFYNRGYYGSVSHDVKAQYQLYFGWFDGNPSNLNPLPPSEAGAKYVEFMGGAENVLKQAKKSYDKGEYRWVAEVLKHLVFADSKNQEAKNLLADSYEQLGYMSESGPWRNFYLTGASELRNGKKNISRGGTTSKDMISGMSSELFFDYLAMRYKGTDYFKDQFNFNILLTDRNEKVGLIVKNGMVTPRIGTFLKNNITATISVSRNDLAILTAGNNSKVNEYIKNGKIKIEGNADAFNQFIQHIDNFDPWFNIVEP